MSNQFPKNNPPQPPCFSIGAKVGDFTVIQYAGRTNENLRKPKTFMATARHWYRVRCACSNEEMRNQHELLDTRRLRMCRECANIARSQSVAEARRRMEKKQAEDSGVPDFARMKF